MMFFVNFSHLCVCRYFFALRMMYNPSSTVDGDPEVGENLSELVAGGFGVELSWSQVEFGARGGVELVVCEVLGRAELIAGVV